MNRFFASVWICLLVGGCIDQQQEVAKYRKVLDGPDKQEIKHDYAPGEPLTLEQALVLANRGSEQLAAQGEDYLQGLIARDRAYSNFMPTISLAPTFSWQNKPLNRGGTILTGGTTGGTTSGGTTGGVSTGGVASSKNTYYAADLPVNARWNIFNGFRDVATLQAAWADIRRRRGLLLDLQATILLETAQTYYNVLLSERSVEVLLNSADYQEARVQDMRSRLRAGLAQPLDVAQSEAQAAATRAQLVAAQRDVANGRTTLAFLANANVATAMLVDRLGVPTSLSPSRELVDVAWRSRQDIAAAAAAVEVARQNVQVAIGEYYPSVSLDLNYYLHRETFPTTVEWAGILTANVPLFTGGLIYQDVRLSWSQLRQAGLQEAQLRRQVAHDVIVAWQTLEASRRSIAELTTEVAAAQEALRQAVQRYRVGLAINLDVLNATNQLLSAQLSLATEEFNNKIDYLDLLRAMGRLPLPSGPNALSMGPASQPTTAETRPLLSNDLSPTTRGGATTQPMFLPPAESEPTTVPTTQPETQPTTSP
jgi:outer membrane protein